MKMFKNQQEKMNESVSNFIEARALPEYSGETPLLRSSYEFIGVEFEIEGLASLDVPYLRSYNVSVKNDHSLKFHGKELLFSRALCGKDIIRALNAVDKEVSRNTPHFEGNRGSTHIHVNVTDLSLRQVLNFLLLSYFMEPYLMQVSNVDRRHSPFAMSTRRTKDVLLVVNRIMNGELAFSTDKYKYRAIGLNSLFGLGSLEFRMFHSTHNKDQVLEWINTLIRIKQSSKEVEDMYVLLSSILSGDMDKTLYGLFGEHLLLDDKTKQYMWDFVRELQSPDKDCVEPDCNNISSFFKKVHKLGE